MSSSDDGGASARMPNQANGYCRKKSFRTSRSGMRNRVEVRDPSAPMTKSHSSDSCRPSCVNVMRGWSVVRSATLVSVTPNRMSPPSSVRWAMRSLSTSCWAYTVTDRPPLSSVRSIRCIPPRNARLRPWWTNPSRSIRSPTPVWRMRSTVLCSRMPALIVCSIVSRVCRSITTDSTPRRCSRCDSINPAGPAPTIPTWVRTMAPLARVLTVVLRCRARAASNAVAGVHHAGLGFPGRHVTRAGSIPERSAEAEHPDGVVLEDQRPDVVLDLELLEVGQPPVGGDDREVRAEQHLALEQRVGGPHQLRREVLRGPPGQVDVDVCLVGGDRDGLVLPRHRGVGQHDSQVREVGGDVVEQHRIGVAQLDPPPARQPGADPGLPGVEQRRNPQLLQRVVQG